MGEIALSKKNILRNAVQELVYTYFEWTFLVQVFPETKTCLFLNVSFNDSEN